MKRNLLTLGSIAVVAAGMVFAQTQATPRQHPQHGRAVARTHMMQALNLTDAQKQQAKAIFDQARQTTQPLRAQLKQNRQALTAAAKAGNEAQIQQLSTDEGRLLGQMIAARTEARSKFYSTLTPEQKAKADQMQERFHERMQKRAGKAVSGE